MKSKIYSVLLALSDAAREGLYFKEKEFFGQCTRHGSLEEHCDCRVQDGLGVIKTAVMYDCTRGNAGIVILCSIYGNSMGADVPYVEFLNWNATPEEVGIAWQEAKNWTRM